MDKKLGSYFIFTLLCISILLCLSCVTEIQFDLPVGFDNSVVVEGKLSKAEKTSIEVKVSQLFNNDGITDFFPIDKVLLIDDQENKIEIPWIRTQLHYKVLDGVFPIDYERSYMIRVEFINGRVVESDYSKLKELKKNNELKYKIDTRTELDEFGEEQITKYVQYYYKTEFSNDIETKYHHDITRTFRFTDYMKPRIAFGNFDRKPETSQKRKTCFITDDRDFLDTKLFDRRVLEQFLDADGMYESMIYEEPLDWTYAEDYNFTIIQESVEESAYNYYEKIGQVLNFSGGMFEARPARIPSNMRYLDDTSSSVYGFFYATEQDTSRLFIPRQDVGRPDTICLREITMFSSGEWLAPETTCRWWLYPCCDCLIFENSTLTKPSFWQD